jgi:hypothetical protein
VQTSVSEIVPSLERRITSLLCDGLIFTACCGVLLAQYAGGTVVSVSPWAGRVSGGILLLMLIGEALSGLTPGRLVTQVRVACEDGSAATVSTLVTRTAIKWVPVALFVFGLWFRSPWADVFWWADAILVQVYATVYYYAVARRGRSAFDLPVRTKIVLAQG